MKPADKAWMKLVTAARQAAPAGDEPAPHGFATRVVARAWAEDPAAGSLLERFALRAVLLSGLLAVVGAVGNVSALIPSDSPSSVEAYFTADDPAAIIMETAP